MRLETVSIQDCIDIHDMKGQATVINDGKVMGFEKENIPTQTANPSGDR